MSGFSTNRKSSFVVSRDKVVTNINSTGRLNIPVYTTLSAAIKDNGFGREGDIIYIKSNATFYGYDGDEWIKLSGGGSSVIAGAGLTQIGSTLNIESADGSINVFPNSIGVNVANNYVWDGINTFTNSVAINGGSFSVIGTGTTNISSDNVDISSNNDLNLSAGGNIILDGTGIDVNGQTISNLADPVNDQDAATKDYVDTAIAANPGIAVKDPVRAATITALPAVTYTNGSPDGVGATLLADSDGNIPNIDSVVLMLGDRVLVKDQVDETENGIYTVTDLGSPTTPFELTRSTDTDENTEIVSAYAFITEGTVNGGSAYICTSPSPITIGISDIVWNLFTETVPVTAGAGLQQMGSTISVDEGYSFNWTGSHDFSTDSFTVSNPVAVQLELATNEPTDTSLEINSINTGAGDGQIALTTDTVEITAPTLIHTIGGSPTSVDAYTRQITQVPTIDDTPTAVATIDFSDTSANFIIARVLARRTDLVGDIAVQEIKQAFSSDGFTVIALDETDRNIFRDLPGLETNFVTSGTDVQIQVTGIPGQDYLWTAVVEIIRC